MTSQNKKMAGLAMLLIGVVFIVSSAILLISDYGLKVANRSYVATIDKFDSYLWSSGRRGFENSPIVTFKTVDGSTISRALRFGGWPTFMFYFKSLAVGDKLPVIYVPSDYNNDPYPDNLIYLFGLPAIVGVIGLLLLVIGLKEKRLSTKG